MKNTTTFENITCAFICILLFSFDANAQWTSLSSGTTSNLNGVFFLNADTGFVAGGDATSNGIILKTVDGGANWTTVYSGATNTNLGAITFSSTTHGFVVGQTGLNVPILLYTTDGGNTWHNYTAVPAAGGFATVKFMDTSNGYITGANLSQYGMKTTDGGNTWTNLPPIADDFSTICFVNTNKGFIAPDDGGLIVTNNGGSTWVSLLSASTGFISDMQFTTPAIGIAVGSASTGPIILKTVNSGLVWTPVGSLTNGYLVAVSFPDPQNGFALGGDTSDSPIIIATADSGSHWDTMVPPITSGFLRDIYFPTANVGYVVGDTGKIFKYSHPTTGIKNIAENTGFQIYPNPVKNACYWKVNNNFGNAYSTVSLYSIDGKLIATAHYEEGMLDISNFINGMYILRFENIADLIEKE